MGKRQIRFTGESIKTKALGDKSVHIVGVDKTVQFVKILSLTPDEINVVDMRKRKFQIPFRDIYEIILDHVSEY